MKTVYLPTGQTIKIPKDHICFTMDENGLWYSFNIPPKIMVAVWIVEPYNSNFSVRRIPELRGPFEPGHWTTQYYDVVDMEDSQI